MSSNKPIILWVSDIFASGFASASIAVLQYMLKHPLFEIHYMPINRTEELDIITERTQEALNLPLDHIHMPNDVRLGFDSIKQIVLKLHPQIIIIVGDNNNLEKHVHILGECYRAWNGKLILYMPVDREIFPIGHFNTLRCNKLLTLTNSSLDTITNCHYPYPLGALPHAVRTDIFHPIRGPNIREILREKLLGLGSDCFLIMNLNQQGERKRFDITLEAFSLFVAKYPTAILVIKQARPNIMELIEKYGIKKHMVFVKYDMSATEMNMVYNCADVGINTSRGEGWGLIPCEMACCAIPQIVPRNTSHVEIFGDDYDFMECEYKDNCGRWAPYVNEAYRLMEKYYLNPELARIVGLQCKDRMNQYTPELIGKRALHELVDVYLDSSP